MDSELRNLHRQLQAEPTALEIRRQYTRASIRAETGNFLILRGCNWAPLEADYLEIEQPLFPQTTEKAASTDNLIIRQQCQAYAVTDLSDLASLLPLQPSGMLILPEKQYRPFHSHVQENLARFPKYPNSQFMASYQPLYDTGYLRTSGIQQVNFFQVPLGAADPVNGLVKDYSSTNMEQGGSLYYPRNFQVTGLSIVLDPETHHYDAIKFASHAWIRMFFGTMDRLIAPATMMTLTTMKTTQSNPLIRLRHSDAFEPIHPFTFEPGSLAESDFTLIPQRNFRVEVNLQTSQQFMQQIKIQAILHGYFIYEIH